MPDGVQVVQFADFVRTLRQGSNAWPGVVAFHNTALELAATARPPLLRAGAADADAGVAGTHVMVGLTPPASRAVNTPCMAAARQWVKAHFRPNGFVRLLCYARVRVASPLS